MKLIDLNYKESNIEITMKKVMVRYCFDEIRIFGIHPSNYQLFELMSNDNDNSLLYAHCKKMLDIAVKEKKALLIEAAFVYENETYNQYDDRNRIEICVPVFKTSEHSDIIVGFVFLASRTELSIDLWDDLGFKVLLSEICSHLIARYDLVKKKESAYQVAYMLCEIIDIKEPFVISRLFNVAYWCSKIASEMELPQEDIDKLHIATLLYDLGRVFISEDILNKEGKLTKKEYKIIKKRVNYSYEIAKKLEPLYEIHDLPEIILNYQERIDAKGYPFCKKGDEIPMLSKILGTAKAISSMLTNSSYRKAKTVPQVINELRNHADTQFDKDVVQAAVAVLISKSKYSEKCLEGIGSFATLNLKVDNEGENKDFNIWGNIRKADNKYVFAPTVRLYDYDQYVIQSCKLYISFNEQIIQYKPTIESVTEDTIVFSQLSFDKDNNTFTIDWLIPAILVTPLRKVYEIFVTSIGGNHIDFYAFSKNIDEVFDEGVIKLTFDDEKKVTLPGIIISHNKIDNKVLFRLKYTAIDYKDLKMVFSHLFRKQIQLRSTASRLR